MNLVLGSFILIILMLGQPFNRQDANVFAEKMSAYYEISTVVEMHYFDNEWWGATVYQNGCTSRVYLSDQFEGELGKDALWKGVLAHEWVHVLQGKNCVNNEINADKIAMQKMWEAREIAAWLRYSIFLQEVRGWSIEQIYATRKP